MRQQAGLQLRAHRRRRLRIQRLRRRLVAFRNLQRRQAAADEAGARLCCRICALGVLSQSRTLA